ncbi:MAG TPA: CCA tRNA nucleotidyltransferase [Devosia sp.]
MSVDDLRKADWLNHPETQAIFAALDGARRRTRAVGGVVRDTILQRPRTAPDIDLATELVPDEVIARAEAAAIAWYPTGIDHGTITLRLGEILAEVTTLRRDTETDGRHAKVVFGTDWVEDARRRDFTLNALYCAADGTLYDPLGGVEDAMARRIRFIGNADQRIAEDGLRVYRFFRFVTSHGDGVLDRDGFEACARAAGKLGHLSAERVGAEMLRILALPKVATTLRQMAAIDLLPLAADKLDAIEGYEQTGGQSVVARLALLGDAKQLRALWRLSNDMLTAINEVERACALAEGGRLGEAAYRHGELAVEGLAVAAARGQWPREQLAEAARELGRTVVEPFPISGHDLAGLGIAPGPALGAELKRLERLWIDSGFTLAKSELLASARP